MDTENAKIEEKIWYQKVLTFLSKIFKMVIRGFLQFLKGILRVLLFIYSVTQKACGFLRNNYGVIVPMAAVALLLCFHVFLLLHDSNLEFNNFVNSPLFGTTAALVVVVAILNFSKNRSEKLFNKTTIEVISWLITLATIGSVITINNSYLEQKISQNIENKIIQLVDIAEIKNNTKAIRNLDTKLSNQYTNIDIGINNIYRLLDGPPIK